MNEPSGELVARRVYTRGGKPRPEPTLFPTVHCGLREANRAIEERRR